MLEVCDFKMVSLIGEKMYLHYWNGKRTGSCVQ
jgi:hypothetical protein